MRAHSQGEVFALQNPMLRLPQVEMLVGLRRSTIYKLMETGKFPRGRKLSPRARRWHAYPFSSGERRLILTRTTGIGVCRQSACAW